LQLGAITEVEELWVIVMMLPLLLVECPEVIGEEYEEILEVEELDVVLEVVEFDDLDELDRDWEVVELEDLEVDEKLVVLVEEEPRLR
jgi:hypothetical protein